ncbi:MAG: hypothetical protein SGARI_000786 [Bacillariaceae sp.]
MLLSRLVVAAALLASLATAQDNVTIGPEDGVIPSDQDGKYTIGPDFVMDPAWIPNDDTAPTGTTFELFMPVANTSYNCLQEHNPYLVEQCAGGDCGQEWGPPGTRNITVYIPAAYQDGDEAGLLVKVENDASSPNDIIMTLLDNLIEAEDESRSLPVMIMVAVGLAGPGAVASNGQCAVSERMNELATISDQYGKFVALEVLPFVLNHPEGKTMYPSLKITDDPAGRGAFVCSEAGHASFRMAFFSPEHFGIAVTFHAAFATGTQSLPETRNLSSIEEYPLDGAE